MARLVIVTDGMPSVLYPCVELAHRLANDGHTVCFVGPKNTNTPPNITFFELPADRYLDFLRQDKKGGIVERLMNLKRRRAEAVCSSGTEAFVRQIREIAPDALLIDAEMHRHIIAISALQMPTLLLNSFSSIWRTDGIPPLHCLARPGHGFRGSRVGSRALWYSLYFWKLRKVIRSRIEHLGCDLSSLLGLLAKEADFDLRQRTERRHWLFPFTFRDWPTLSLHAAEFEFSTPAVSRVRFVGPLVGASRAWGDPTTGSEPEITQTLKNIGPSQKLIYVAFGSKLHAPQSLVDKLCALLNRHEDWVVLLTGASDRCADKSSGRLHMYDWVPQTTVLRQADIAITHGGINTIDECILEAVPMIIFCGFETDMPGNAARVLHHNIGLLGDAEESTDTLDTQLSSLFNDEAYRINIERLRTAYLAYQKNRVVERTVTEFLQQGDL